MTTFATLQDLKKGDIFRMMQRGHYTTFVADSDADYRHEIGSYFEYHTKATGKGWYSYDYTAEVEIINRPDDIQQERPNEPMTLRPFLNVTDHEGFAAYSEGYHTHGGTIPHINRISFGYPLHYWYRTQKRLAYKQDRVKNLGDLLRRISGELRHLDNQGNLGAPHAFNDYFIEVITIKNGTAFVEFGS